MDYCGWIDGAAFGLLGMPVYKKKGKTKGINSKDRPGIHQVVEEMEQKENYRD
jgi:hypothetical protein